MTELEKKASELASSFASLEVVNRYKRIKTLIAQDEYLSSLDNVATVCIPPFIKYKTITAYPYAYLV